MSVYTIFVDKIFSMKKHITVLLTILFQVGFSQQNQNWKGYFSYSQIKDVAESSHKIFAGAENTLFVKNLGSNEVKTINTIDGLSGESLTAIHHSDTYKKTLVGYENGLMVVVNDDDGSMLNVVDIINKNLPSNIKKINHFMEYNGVVYISCDFGIVQYKLATLEFGDTYFIGANGKEIKIFQTTVFEGYIYAVTQFEGMKRASVTNPNLIDYTQWETFDPGYWTGVVSFSNRLIAANQDNKVYRRWVTGFIEIGNLGQDALDLRATSDYLIATSLNHSIIFDSNLNQKVNLYSNQINIAPVTFSCATVVDNLIFIGTNENGIITSPMNDSTNFSVLMPDGPIKNNIFSICASPSSLWAVYGDYDLYYNPYPLEQYGISKYADNYWLNIPYKDVLNAESLSKVTINPNNESQVYISSFHKGLMKVENDVPTTLYNQDNSGLESLDFLGSYISVRINGTAFDKEGNLWVTNCLVKNGLKMMKKSTGEWLSYNTGSIVDNYKTSNLNKIVIDKSGTKWIATYADGVIAFNEKSNIFKKISDGPDSGNLPSRDVRAIAVDNRSQVWIGTNKGLRVLANTSSYNGANQMKANPIIIMEEGVAQELLYEQFITDIAVNGSNQKWIGTADSGVFLFSADGQQTIYHFTKDNSPLPSNVINDIDINAVTGEVFFATDKGMVSFKGTSTKPAENLDNVYVYPNPVRPEFEGTVKISGLITKANVKITDIEGNLVFETTSEGGTVEWDTTAFGKYKVASGVYMIFVVATDGSQTTVSKVMIIR